MKIRESSAGAPPQNFGPRGLLRACSDSCAQPRAAATPAHGQPRAAATLPFVVRMGVIDSDDVEEAYYARLVAAGTHTAQEITWIKAKRRRQEELEVDTPP